MASNWTHTANNDKNNIEDILPPCILYLRKYIKHELDTFFTIISSHLQLG